MIDWDDIKLALAIARTGSLSGAAKMLDMDQSTVGRRLTAMEASLETTLFKRSKQGVVPTEAGQAFIARSGEIERQTISLVEQVKTTGQQPGGVVRLCGNQWTLDRMVSSGLPAFLAANSKIELRLISGRPRTSLWHHQPSLGLWFETQPMDGAFQIKLGKVPYAVYAAPGCDPQDWVVFHDEDNPSNRAGLFAQRVTKGCARIRLRALDAETLHQAVASGIGRALLPCCIGEADPRIERQLLDEPEFERDLYLHVHPDSLNSSRVQAVMTWIREAFPRMFNVDTPDASTAPRTGRDAAPE